MSGVNSSLNPPLAFSLLISSQSLVLLLSPLRMFSVLLKDTSASGAVAYGSSHQGESRIQEIWLNPNMLSAVPPHARTPVKGDVFSLLSPPTLRVPVSNHQLSIMLF